jgi:hypothetical protein
MTATKISKALGERLHDMKADRKGLHHAAEIINGGET